jgi:hypothetical protein
VKPCTPSPAESTSTVPEPYTMYPAAPISRPGRSTSCMFAFSPSFDLRRKMQKIDPMVALTSMFDEPSSGSMQKT